MGRNGQQTHADPAPAVVHIDDAAIGALLDLPAVTQCMAEAFAAWGTGRAATTQRVRAATSEGMISGMAAVVPPFKGGKVYATKDGRFSFVNVLFDLEGRLLGTLDGDALTRLRTPATSALALRHLAAPGATTAALLGGGRQAWNHLLMLRDELPGLSRMCIYARRPDAAEQLAARAVDHGIAAEAAPTPSAAVGDADVVVTVTSASEPLFPADVVDDRTLICAVGSTKADRSEIGPDVVERCVTVVADDVTGSRVECGDLVRAAAEGRFSWDQAVELHDVVAGNVSVERAGRGPVLFETQGVALQDVAAAGLAWQRYHQAGQGTGDRNDDNEGHTAQRIR
jgi:ornithine cyclodeaminase/alanine dehydrogenase-like protein (mu-crystallin family)